MAKRNNNLLGVGGQRKKLSRADQQGSAPARAADRRPAADQKQELLRKMRERVQADQPERTGQADQTDQTGQAELTDPPAGTSQAPEDGTQQS